MINVSNAFKQKLADGFPVTEEVEITFSDGTVKTVSKEILNSGNDIIDGVDGSSFPVGQTVCKSCKITLDNSQDQWKEYYFYGAKLRVKLKMSLDDGTVETINRGTFTVTTPEEYGEDVEVTALDDMYKANQEYSTKLSFPQTAQALLRDVCSTCNIKLGVTSMAHGSISIAAIPDNVTFRTVIGYIAMLESANARIDSNGYLRFLKWDFSSAENGNSAGEGVNTPHILRDYLSAPTLSTDDIIITGIKVKSGEDAYQYGLDGYVLELENELLTDKQLENVAKWIGADLIGSTFRSLEGDLAYNPLIEFGDMARTYDRKENAHITPITYVASPLNGKTTVKTQTDSPVRGSSKYNSNSVKALVAARKLVENEKSAREEAIKNLNETLKNASGMYATDEKQEDGSTISYIHDKPTLAESKNVIKVTSEAIGISNDGGKTYPFGFVLTGELITRLLYTEGINADYINTGNLLIKDSKGNVLFDADFNTKTVRISGDVITIGSKSLSDSLAKLLEESKAYTDGKSTNLLNGYDLSPENLDNYWMVQGTVTQNQTDPSGGKKAVLLTGTDATDNFISANRSNNNPISGTGKYIVSVYLKSTSARTVSITFNRETHSCAVTTSWKKFTFTVDISSVSSEGNNFEIGGFSSVAKGVKLYAYNPSVVRSYTPQEIFNLLTNNGKIPGITMLDGKLYINASYINSGTMSASRIKGGTLVLGGASNGNGMFRLLDASGNPVVAMFNGGLRIYTSYTDDDNCSFLQFSRTGIKPIVKSNGIETIWKNGIEPSSNWIIRYTSEGKIIINADKINTDALVTGAFTARDSAVFEKTVTVKGNTGLRGDAYVNGDFTFVDYGESGKTNQSKRRPVASTSTDQTRVAYIGSGTGSWSGHSGTYRRFAVNGQWGSSGYSTEYFYNGTQVSDIRLKKNIKDCDISALDAVMKMKSRQYDWKKSGAHEYIGFVADELEEIDQQLTVGGGYNEDGSMDIKHINSPHLLNYAIKAIQELAETVKKQDDKIKELEARINGN